MPLKPGSPEWEAKVLRMIAEEALQPESWWYLSFVGEGGFLGAALVRARGMTSALQRAHRLGINPGGRVKAWNVGEETGGLPVDRLLSREDLGDAMTEAEWERQEKGEA
jgi:hypothetical protein